MSLVNYSFTALKDTDPAGLNIVAAQAVSVKIDLDDSLATIFSDSAGASPITQPGAVTDANGVLEFFVEAGIYKIESGTRTETQVIDNGTRTKFDTSANAAASKHLRVGDKVKIEDRANADFNVISGTSSANTFDIIASTQTNISLQYSPVATILIEALGDPSSPGVRDAAVVLALSSDLLLDSPTLQRESTKFTVGASGQFSTVTEAVTFLSLLKPTLTNNQTNHIRIEMLAGYVFSEQLISYNVDLSWMKLISVDAVVTIARSSLTVDVGIPSFPALYSGGNGGSLPEIACQFDMDTSGTGTNRDGIVVEDGSSVRVRADSGVTSSGGSGLVAIFGASAVTGDIDVDGVATAGTGGSNFSDSVDAGMQVRNGAKVAAPRANVSGSGNGLFIRSSGFVDFWFGDGTNCTGSGIRCRDASSVNGRSCDVSGSGKGIFATHSSLCNFRLATADNCTENGIHCAGAGTTVEAPGVSIDGTTDGAAVGGNAGSGILCDNGGIVVVTTSDSSIINSELHNLAATDGGKIVAQAAILTGAGSRPAFSNKGGDISIGGATCTGSDQGAKATNGSHIRAVGANVGTVISGNAFEITNGGIIFASGSTGSLSVTANAITAAGIIFK